VDAQPAPAALAVPLALFIVEATTNALKHAFPDDRPGLIEIHVTEDLAANLMRVTVRDDGVGLASEPREGRTGVSLMNAFARQLGGVTKIAPAEGGGAEVSLEFPITPEEEATAPLTMLEKTIKAEV
jgi:two-component sensor histidine kinase